MIKFFAKTCALLCVLGLGVAFAASQAGATSSGVSSATTIGSQYLVLPLAEAKTGEAASETKVLSDWEFTARARPTCRFVR